MPAAIGDHRDTIDTPALILDLDAFEENLRLMKAATEGRGVRLRPHAKSHKCPKIALKQIAAGAVGICCQKVSEAAAFVEAGVTDILITNQVVGAKKLARLMDLAENANIGILVDDLSQVDDLHNAAAAREVSLDVYIEVDVGAKRCGVPPGPAVVALAERIVASDALRFAGLHCYQGSAQHLRGPEERAQAIALASHVARDAVHALEDRGIPVDIITGAGTGTLVHERESGVYNELQPGSYVFMDRDYADNILGDRDVAFRHALFILTTVMSRPTDDRAVLDAGLKSMSVDSGMPSVWQRDDLQYTKASDEHGVLTTPSPEAVSLGDKLLLVPGHCDPTVNLYDHIVCVRGEVVEDIWPITARGASL